MTVKELIEALDSMGKEHLDDKVVMFNGPSYFSPSRVEVMGDGEWGEKFNHCVLVD